MPAFCERTTHTAGAAARSDLSGDSGQTDRRSGWYRQLRRLPARPIGLSVTVELSTERSKFDSPALPRPANSSLWAYIRWFLGARPHVPVHSERSRGCNAADISRRGQALPSLAILEIIRDVSSQSTDSAYSLDMTEAQQAARSTQRSIQLPRP